MFRIFLIIALSVAVVSGCGKKSSPEHRTAESLYVDGIELFNNGKYQKARELFDVIKLQHPASQFADDAQFYLAEISFERKEFIMAAFNYGMLRRLYPSSTHTKQALYKTAICYYELSPNYDRDQEYTHKAIEAFQEFQYVYPDDELAKQSSEYIQGLRNKLAFRELSTANLYMKLESPNSSVIYYDVVIREYNDTEHFEDAYIGKLDAMVMMEKFEEARGLIRVIKSTFPNSRNLYRVENIEADIMRSL